MSNPQSAASGKPGSLVSAISWNTVSTIGAYVVQFGRSVFVARLLEKDAFGLFGMAVTVLQAASVLTEFGISSWIIANQKDHDESLTLDTMWSLEILRRALVSALLVAAAYPATLYFGDHRLLPVTLVLGLAPLLQGFQNVGLILCQRRMQFRPVAIHRLLAEILSCIATALVAWFYPTVWALVLSMLMGNAISVAVSYAVSPYRPRWRIDGATFRKSLNFGKHMFVVGLLTYVTTQFDNLVVGRYLGTEILALYMLAYRLANLPVDIFGSILSTALFPAYSQLSSMRPDQLREEFVRISGLSSLFLVVIIAPFLFLSEPMIAIVYGSKWLAAAPMLALLAWQGLARGLPRVLSPLLLAIHRPDLDAKAKIVEAAVFVPLTIVLVQRWGAPGAAWAGIVSYTLAYLLRLGAVCLVWKDHRVWLIRKLTAPILRAVVVYAACKALLSNGANAWAVTAAYAVAVVAAAWFLDPDQRAAGMALWRRFRGRSA